MGLVFVMGLIGLGTFAPPSSVRTPLTHGDNDAGTRSKVASVGTFFIGAHECLRGNGPSAGLVCAGTAPLIRPAFQQGSVSERNATYSTEKNR